LHAQSADGFRAAHHPVGPDTSSDRLRKSARCTRCGGKGAMLMHPIYVDRIVGFQPFPL
jgi:hypothetical protein